MTPDELRDLLKKHGWTQDNLAAMLPIKSTRTIRWWLSGEYPIPPVTVQRIKQLAAEHERKRK